MRILEYSAVIEFDAEAKRYVGHVPALRGANTEAETLEQLRINLEEVIQLVLDDMESEGAEEVPDSVIGIEKVAVER